MRSQDYYPWIERHDLVTFHFFAQLFCPFSIKKAPSHDPPCQGVREEGHEEVIDGQSQTVPLMGQCLAREGHKNNLEAWGRHGPKIHGDGGVATGGEAAFAKLGWNSLRATTFPKRFNSLTSVLCCELHGEFRRLS